MVEMCCVHHIKRRPGSYRRTLLEIETFSLAEERRLHIVSSIVTMAHSSLHLEQDSNGGERGGWWVRRRYFAVL